SPLAIRATEIFRKHPEYFDDSTKCYLRNGEDPLDLPNLRYTLTTDESRAINETPGSAIVISASGMATAGRIKHHLKHNLWRKGASIVFCGFQAMGTTGRKIVDGAKRVRIFGEDVAVGAKVFTIGGFSGHAGQSELLAWLKSFMQPHIQIILTHGEPKAQKALAQLLKEQFGVTPIIPSYLEELELTPGKAAEHAVLDAERAKPQVDWAYLVRGAEQALGELKDRAAHAGERPWVQQAELRSRLLEITRSMHELISEM
ncbi:MAG: MBL fold metallo-hydrolase RNA specificity domain-containing protein, partial [Desulfovibrionaceae bacterium]